MAFLNTIHNIVQTVYFHSDERFCIISIRVAW